MQNKLSWLVTCILAMLFCQLAPVGVWAADLRAPFDFESTSVLPAKVRNPRFKDLILFMDEKFNDTGRIEGLGYKLNKNVTWQDVVNGKSDPTERAVVEGKVKSLGYSMNDVAGTTSGVVNTYVNVKVPVLGYGVNDRLTLAVAVPVLSVDVNADTGFIKGENGQAQAFVDSVAQGDPQKATEASQKFNDAINSKLQEKGYEKVESRSFTAIGDVKLVGKYLLRKRENWALAIKGEVTAPTGIAPNADKALDIPTGDGQWDVGSTLVFDQYLNHSHATRANAYAGYTAQLPDRIDRRLPVSDTDTLSTDKENMRRDLGDIVSTGTGITHEFSFGMNIGAAYAFQYLGATRYSGSIYPEYRYKLLEAMVPRQTLHSLTLGTGFSSVQMYKEKRFKIPFQANLAYCHPLAGNNVVRNDFVALEMVMFF